MDYNKMYNLDPNASSRTHFSQIPPQTTFVHKLYKLITEELDQNLISWTQDGTAFAVLDIDEFSKQLLPKHFKHSNFSSFVRQLNMYGFHKTNKSSRVRSPSSGSSSTKDQFWEFSHPNFQRHRFDLLSLIKRKPLETESLRRETGNLQSVVSALQNSHNKLNLQVRSLQRKIYEMSSEMNEFRKIQETQQRIIKALVQGNHENLMDQKDLQEAMQENKNPGVNSHMNQGFLHSTSPSILVTGPALDNSVPSSQFCGNNENMLGNNLCPPSARQRKDSNVSMISVDWSFLESNENMGGQSEQDMETCFSVSSRENTPDSPSSVMTTLIRNGYSPSPSYFDQAAISTPLPPSPMPGTPRVHMNEDDYENFDLNTAQGPVNYGGLVQSHLPNRSHSPGFVNMSHSKIHLPGTQNNIQSTLMTENPDFSFHLHPLQGSVNPHSQKRDNNVMSQQQSPSNLLGLNAMHLHDFNISI